MAFHCVTYIVQLEHPGTDAMHCCELNDSNIQMQTNLENFLLLVCASSPNVARPWMRNARRPQKIASLYSESVSWVSWVLARHRRHVPWESCGTHSLRLAVLSGRWKAAQPLCDEHVHIIAFVTTSAVPATAASRLHARNPDETQKRMKKISTTSFDT